MKKIITDKLKEMLTKNVPDSITTRNSNTIGKSILEDGKYDPNYDIVIKKFIKENVKNIDNINMIVVNEHTYRSMFNLQNTNELQIVDPFISNTPVDMSPPLSLLIDDNDVTITISNAVNDNDIFIKSEKGKTLL